VSWFERVRDPISEAKGEAKASTDLESEKRETNNSRVPGERRSESGTGGGRDSREWNRLRNGPRR